MVSAAGLEPATHAGRQQNYKQQLARPAYSMHDTTKSMRCRQDIGLGARRVPGPANQGDGYAGSVGRLADLDEDVYVCAARRASRLCEAGVPEQGSAARSDRLDAESPGKEISLAAAEFRVRDAWPIERKLTGSSSTQ